MDSVPGLNVHRDLGTIAATLSIRLHVQEQLEVTPGLMIIGVTTECSGEEMVMVTEIGYLKLNRHNWRIHFIYPKQSRSY